MGNTDNLLKGNPKTEFKSGLEAVKNGAKGGKESGKSKRRAKSMRELAQMMANCKPPKDIAKITKEIFPDLEVDDITNKVVLLSKQFEKASEGDTKAFEVLRDTSGEKPIDKIENINEDKITSIKIVDGEKVIELK